LLRDRQDIGSVYKYLSANHSAETEELKAALQTVLDEPAAEPTGTSPAPVVDIAGIDLSLELMPEQDIPEDLPDCRWFYRIMRGGVCVGTADLAFAGMEAMLIHNLAYDVPGMNTYLFELLKQKHPGILCWNLYFPNKNSNDDLHFDLEGKKRRFADDNGFTFYTNARWDRYIKMLVPHDEVYNSSRYRFALLDGSMDGVSFRFFGANNLDWYDGKMTGWRVTDCDFGGALIYDSYMGNSRFYDSTMTGCEFKCCDFTGSTIDGIPIEDALVAYRTLKGERT